MVPPRCESSGAGFVFLYFAREFVSMVPPKTTKRSKKYSVTRFSSMFIPVTRYSFHISPSASQLPSTVEAGVKAQ